MLPVDAAHLLRTDPLPGFWHLLIFLRHFLWSKYHCQHTEHIGLYCTGEKIKVNMKKSRPAHCDLGKQWVDQWHHNRSGKHISEQTQWQRKRHCDLSDQVDREEDRDWLKQIGKCTKFVILHIVVLYDTKCDNSQWKCYAIVRCRRPKPKQTWDIADKNKDKDRSDVVAIFLRITSHAALYHLKIMPEKTGFMPLRKR